jgi:hypothetical protein
MLSARPGRGLPRRRCEAGPFSMATRDVARAGSAISITAIHATSTQVVATIARPSMRAVFLVIVRIRLSKALEAGMRKRNFLTTRYDYTQNQSDHAVGLSLRQTRFEPDRSLPGKLR